MLLNLKTNTDVRGNAMNLSKSKYCKGIQCPKILWMDKNKPELFDESVVNEALLNTGQQIGDLAMAYFGEFSEVTFTFDKAAMLAETERLLAAGTKVIAEASFSYDGNFCMVDILRAIPGGYELIEVKGSTGRAGDGPKEAKPIYLHDMAYQAYVLTGFGLQIKKVCLMQLNKDYIRKGDLDIQNLFVLSDCTDTIFQMKNDVPGRIEEIKAAATEQTEPTIDIGSHCDNPYECGYKGWCFRHLPKHNVFDIGWSMWGSKKEEAYKSGFISFQDVVNNGVKLSEKQALQVNTVLNNLPPKIDKTAIHNFLSTLRYPLYHLDFETFQQAIPMWDNVSPYMQIPFQYSIHVQSKPCGEGVHKEFLAKEGQDPREAFAKQLCMDVPKDACVLAYNMSFEKTCIKNLAKQFPSHASHLMSIHDNMVDLAAPFRSGAYYCREMGGSFSIKSVLPALCPNDPELDYKALDLIQDGGDAMTAYASLHEKTQSEIEEIRKALLAYCKLDTLAMTKILDVLNAV